MRDNDMRDIEESAVVMQPGRDRAAPNEPKPFSTSADAPLDREPTEVPRMAVPLSGAELYDQIDETADPADLGG